MWSQLLGLVLGMGESRCSVRYSGVTGSQICSSTWICRQVKQYVDYAWIYYPLWWSWQAGGLYAFTQYGPVDKGNGLPIQNCSWQEKTTTCYKWPVSAMQRVTEQFLIHALVARLRFSTCIPFLISIIHVHQVVFLSQISLERLWKLSWALVVPKSKATLMMSHRLYRVRKRKRTTKHQLNSLLTKQYWLLDLWFLQKCSSMICRNL